jgi:hypothetical protein
VLASARARREEGVAALPAGLEVVRTELLTALDELVSLPQAEAILGDMPTFIPHSTLEAILSYTLSEVASSTAGRYAIRKIRQRLNEVPEVWTTAPNPPEPRAAQDETEETVEALAAHSACLTRLSMALGVTSSFQEVEAAVAKLVEGAMRVRQLAQSRMKGGLATGAQFGLVLGKTILAIVPPVPGDAVPQVESELDALLLCLKSAPAKESLICYAVWSEGCFQVDASALLGLAEQAAQLTQVLRTAQDVEHLLATAQAEYTALEVGGGSEAAMQAAVLAVIRRILQPVPLLPPLAPLRRYPRHCGEPPQPTVSGTSQ